MLTAVPVDPPQGCRLCHVDDSGGLTLRPFGLLLSGTYGVKPYDEGSLSTALDALDAQGSPLSTDLKTGIDPNLQATNDLSPEYGCAAAPPGGRQHQWGLLWLAGCAAAMRFRRKRAPGRAGAAISGERR
jgi:hypothetical protein